MIQELSVSLDAWIIQDGNYGDFHVGQHASFAIEFYSEAGLSPSSPAIASLTPESDSTYRAVGQVVHRGIDWWVIDVGLPMYMEQPPPHGVQVGDWVSGTINVGVDPFFYFERLSKRAASPELIFDWMIERIEMATAPLVEVSPRHFVRDPGGPARVAVPRTDAWQDDNGHGDYVLRCRRLSGPGRRTLHK